jgi:hypothetical protein
MHNKFLNYNDFVGNLKDGLKFVEVKDKKCSKLNFKVLQKLHSVC